jgi:hypothetical protein
MWIDVCSDRGYGEVYYSTRWDWSLWGKGICVELIDSGDKAGSNQHSEKFDEGLYEHAQLT